MRYEILSSEYYDDKGQSILWSIFFDGQQFEFDVEDLIEIAKILKTFFEGMGIDEVVIFPHENREKVMKAAPK